MPSAPSLPSSIQAKLDLGETQARPLGDLNAAMRDLNLDADEVRTLVQMGYLVAFNIAVDTGGRWRRRAKRSQLRVLARSVEQYRVLKIKRPCALAWPQILRLILPHQRSVVKGTEIQRALNCDRGHVENLVTARHLVVLQASRPGPGGSWTISRASFEEFLKSRLQ